MSRFLGLSQPDENRAANQSRPEDTLSRLTASEDDSRASVRPVKITILGTSNSVMSRGYVQGLSLTAGIETIANTSLGSSHSVMVPLIINDDALAQSDFAIIDLSVNEQKAVNAQLYSLDTMRDIFFYILGKCADLKVIPVVLLMPMKWHENDYALAAAYRALCQDYGVLYYDPQAQVKDEAAGTGRSWLEMFKDDHHLLPETAQRVGLQLGEALKRANTTTGEAIIVACPRFDYIAVSPFAAGLPVVDRRTKLIGARLVRMTSGERLTVPVETGAFVVGIGLNMSNTNANLRLEGETCAVKRLNNAFYQPDGPVRLVVWQLISPVQAKDNLIQLTCEPDKAEAVVESNCHFGRNPKFPTPSMVEIAGLVVRRAGPPSQHSWRPFACPRLNAD